MTSLITLKSPEGQKLLSEVRDVKEVFQPILHQLFKKQIGNQNCGVQSCAMLLGAHDIGSRNPLLKQTDIVQDLKTKYNELALFEMPETRAKITEQYILDSSGIGLVDIHWLLEAHNVEATIYHAADVSEDEFRQHALEALSSPNSAGGIIVNYHMSTLGQTPTYGHHSPLGGYHEKTDRFLLLDVWKETEECWAKTADLYRAMNTLDDATNETRGYVVLK